MINKKYRDCLEKVLAKCITKGDLKFVLFIILFSIYHIMSSLYDKYYSEHNRTYMYNLIQNIIRKDYNIDIASNETYNQFSKPIL